MGMGQTAGRFDFTFAQTGTAVTDLVPVGSRIGVSLFWPAGVTVPTDLTTPFNLTEMFNGQYAKGDAFSAPAAPLPSVTTAGAALLGLFGVTRVYRRTAMQHG
jgi:hypothetical protein